MGTKEQREKARADASAALLDQAEKAAGKAKKDGTDPFVLLALLDQTRRLAVTAGNQEAAQRAKEKAKEVRKLVVSAEAKKLGFRVVARKGSTDRTLAKVRVPEDEVPEGFADDLAEAFLAVCEKHGVEAK